MSSSNKRHSILPPIDKAGPKPPVNFSSSLVIADSAILLGHHSITIQSESVVHPRARLESLAGSILIGRRCIIQERCHIGAAPLAGDGRGGGVSLGDYVTVEAATIIEAGGTDIGEGSIIGVGSRVGSGAKIGKHCTITPLSVIAPGQVISDSTVVYSNGTTRPDRRGMMETKSRAQVRQIEQLRRMIPSNPAKFQ